MARKLNLGTFCTFSTFGFMSVIVILALQSCRTMLSHNNDDGCNRLLKHEKPEGNGEYFGSFLSSKRLYSGLLKITQATQNTTYTANHTASEYCPVLVHLALESILADNPQELWHSLRATFYTDIQCLKPTNTSGYSLLLWVKPNADFTIESLRPSGYIALNLEASTSGALSTLAQRRSLGQLKKDVQSFDQATKLFSLRALHNLNQDPKDKHKDKDIDACRTEKSATYSQAHSIIKSSLKQNHSSSIGCYSYSHLVTFQSDIQASLAQIIRFYRDGPMYSHTTPKFFQNKEQNIAQELSQTSDIYRDIKAFAKTQKTMDDFENLTHTKTHLSHMKNQWKTLKDAALLPESLAHKNTFFVSSHVPSIKQPMASFHDIQSIASELQATPLGLTFHAKQETMQAMHHYGMLLYQNTPIATLRSFDNQTLAKIDASQITILQAQKEEYQAFMNERTTQEDDLRGSILQSIICQ